MMQKTAEKQNELFASVFTVGHEGLLWIPVLELLFSERMAESLRQIYVKSNDILDCWANQKLMNYLELGMNSELTRFADEIK